jgi:hypothetical protein
MNVGARSKKANTTKQTTKPPMKKTKKMMDSADEAELENMAFLSPFCI